MTLTKARRSERSVSSFVARAVMNGGLGLAGVQQSTRRFAINAG
jgi:hypothetical protein